MPALNRDLTIEQGATWSHGFLPRISENGGVTFDPFLEDDWTIRAQIRAALDSVDVLHEWSTTVGNAEVVDTVAVLTVEPAESTAWEWRTGCYDVEVTNPAGDITYRIAQGLVTVRREVTRG